MDYQNTLKYLYENVPMFQQVGNDAYKPGLENTQKLDKHLGHPHQQFKTIHIAGTNGKGSCSHSIAAVLQTAGYRVGLFTSPHLIDFRERIRINGEMMPEEYVVNFVEEHRSFFEPLHPSFFELTTAMAFRYFADREVDIAIIEVGMGGRLDCTNIIHPHLCVITNIGFDHMQYLGNTLTEIAKEKAGIIKENIPVVIGETQDSIKRVFTMKAKEMGAPILDTEDSRKHNTTTWLSCSGLQEERKQLEETQQEWLGQTEERPGIIEMQDLEDMLSVLHIYLNETLEVIDDLLRRNKDAIKISSDMFPTGLFMELSGLYQHENIHTILTALDTLVEKGLKINPKDYLMGLANVSKLTGLMGRWQKVHSSPDVICDTAHNVDGIKYISKQLDSLRQNCKQELHIVFGMANDKEIGSVLQELPKQATYYFTKASVKRALPEDELLALAEKAGLKGTTYPTVTDAVQAAQKNCLPKDVIFVGGSNFIVADLLANRNALNLD